MTWPLIRSGSCGPVVHGPGFGAIDLESACSQLSVICQMGLVKFRDGILGTRHAHYVIPPLPDRENFGRHIIAIHGITRRMVDNADGSELMLPRLAGFTGDLPLVARNVVAERSMIRTFEAIGVVPPSFTSYCRQRAARLRLRRPRTGNTGASTSSAPRQRNGIAGTLLPV